MLIAHPSIKDEKLSQVTNLTGEVILVDPVGYFPSSLDVAHGDHDAMMLL